MRSARRYLSSAFSRGFAWTPPAPAPSSKVLPTPPPCPPSAPVPDAHGDSDSGTAPISNASGRVLGRRSCQAHCVCLSGKQASALLPAPCPGKRAQRPTLMYDDWLIHHGERVWNANFPLTAELCTQHRSDYADRETKNKCTQLGCWGNGAPT